MPGRLMIRALFMLIVWGLPVALNAAEARQKILTQSDVERVLKIFPAYVRWIKEWAPHLKIDSKERNPSLWLVAGMFQKGAADYIQSQGWDFKDFVLTAGSLFLAYSRLESEKEIKDDTKLKKVEPQKDSPPLQTMEAPSEDQPLPKPPAHQGTAAPAEVPEANLEMARKNLEAIRAMLSTIW
jgi:hypothetical protein